MNSLLIASAALAFSLQSATPQPPPVEIVDLSQLPVAEAAAPRCAVVFALIKGLQQAGDERASKWPDLASANGTEFFVRAMAKLMDDRNLERGAISQLAANEAALLSKDDYKAAHELMEPCLLMKQASGL